MKIEEKIGFHLMFGIPGHELSQENIRHFKVTNAQGLIVFRPNFSSIQNFKKLLSDFEGALQRRLLVAIDHEGGRVIHIPSGITFFPDNLVLGNTGKSEYAKKQGSIEANELRRIGIDINLAPTLDVLTEDYSPNIGIRSYGKDPAMVARLGADRIMAMQAGGISACAKHFPGLGAATLDPHVDLPVLNSDWKEMKAMHLLPFIHAIKAGVDCMMTSHPIYPKLDERNIPVTFSRKIAHELLRTELGFNGVLLSDDLEMGALKNLCSIGESAVRALEAGHDMVLVCHDVQAQRDVFDAISQAYREGRLKENNLNQTIKRIERLKKKRKTRFAQSPNLGSMERQELTKTISDEGTLGLSQVPVKSYFSQRSRKKLLVVFPRVSSLAQLIAVEETMLNEKNAIREILGACHIEAEVAVPDINPSSEQIQEILHEAKKYEFVIYFCYDAHQYPSNRKMLELIQLHAKKSAVVLLRDPFDRVFVQNNVLLFSAFGFRRCQVEAVLKKICSKE